MFWARSPLGLKICATGRSLFWLHFESIWGALESSQWRCQQKTWFCLELKMRFFLAAKRTFCVITLYALKIRASFFKARFVANLDDYKCVACCKRAYSCGETIKNMLAQPIFWSNTVHMMLLFRSIVWLPKTFVHCKNLCNQKIFVNL